MSRTMNLLNACAILICTTGISESGMIVQGESKTIQSPIGEPLEVGLEFFLDLTDELDGQSFSSGGYQIRVDLSGESAGDDVKISSVILAKDRPAAGLGFVSSSVDNGGTLGFRGLGSLSDFAINDGDGLGRVNLEVQPGAVGTYELSLVTGTDQTLVLTAGGATNADFDTASAFLNIVPEPTSGLLFCLGVTSALLIRRKRV